MKDYWHTISIKHQDKVRNLARKHGLTVERAFRNIVRHLGWEMRQISQPSLLPLYMGLLSTAIHRFRPWRS